MKLLLWKKSGKSLEFWIQISVRALCLVPFCRVPDPTPTIQFFFIKTYHHPKSDNNCINSHRLQYLLFAFCRRCTTWGFDSDRRNYIWPFRHVRPGGLLQISSILWLFLKALIHLYAAIGHLHDDIILLLRSDFFRVMLFVQIRALSLELQNLTMKGETKRILVVVVKLRLLAKWPIEGFLSIFGG